MTATKIRLNDAGWLSAKYYYEHGDSAELERLLRSDRPVPEAVRSFLADVIAGQVKPPKRGKSNRKIPLKVEMRISAGAHLPPFISMMNASDLEDIADRNGKELGELRKDLDEIVKGRHAAVAKSLGVSVDTVRKIYSKGAKRRNK